MSIRIATAQDLPQLILWAKKFKAQTDWRDEPMCPKELELWLGAHIKRSDRVILMDERGAMGAVIAPKMPFTSSVFADESFWFSEGSGLRLLSAMEKWAEARDAKLRLFTLSSTPALLERVLERKSYSLAQKTWQIGV